MDEKDFELLQALADSRNITKAADKLYITQSALSKRIRSIERELGVELLLRSHQGIRFTPSGEAVLAHSRAAAREMEQMRRNLDALHDCIMELPPQKMPELIGEEEFRSNLNSFADVALSILKRT